jgi:alpha-beta hydrolase superfamily lysophospholipase
MRGRAQCAVSGQGTHGSSSTSEEIRALKKWQGDILFLILIGALVAGWISLYPAPGESPLAPLEPPAGLEAETLPTYAGAQGTQLAYRYYPPQGPATHVVVLLHDTLLHSAWYERLGQDLAQRGVAVYVPDRRGWGHSAGDRREAAKDKSVLLEDITAMIAVAQARTPQLGIYLAGHGRAAGLVLQYAATQRPLSGVILLSPYLSETQPNLRPEGWRHFATAHPVEAFLARAGLSNWPVFHYNWPQAMVDVDPLLETRCALSCQQETQVELEARGGADSDTAQLGPQASPLQTSTAETEATETLNWDSPIQVPLLCVQAQDGPLFDPDKTALVLAALGAKDQHLETCPGVDYLTLIEVAAGPIADWLDKR